MPTEELLAVFVVAPPLSKNESWGLITCLLGSHYEYKFFIASQSINLERAAAALSLMKSKHLFACARFT